MKHTFTIARHGEQQGVLEWDDEAGTFLGFAAQDVDSCADVPAEHPAFHPSTAIPRRDSAALGVLLAALGWDIPAELQDAIETASVGKKQPPAHTTP